MAAMIPPPDTVFDVLVRGQQMSEETGASEAEMTQCELPPGPAFVLATRLPRGIGDLMRWENWKDRNVPLGYIWRPATDCTPAGWVRPMGYLAVSD